MEWSKQTVELFQGLKEGSGAFNRIVGVGESRCFDPQLVSRLAYGPVSRSVEHVKHAGYGRGGERFSGLCLVFSHIGEWDLVKLRIRDQ